MIFLRFCALHNDMLRNSVSTEPVFWSKELSFSSLKKQKLIPTFSASHWLLSCQLACAWNTKSQQTNFASAYLIFYHIWLKSNQKTIRLPYARFVYFYPIFHCGLYCRAVSVTDNLCTKQGNSSISLESTVYNQERVIMARIRYIKIYDSINLCFVGYATLLQKWGHTTPRTIFRDYPYSCNPHSADPSAFIWISLCLDSDSLPFIVRSKTLPVKKLFTFVGLIIFIIFIKLIDVVIFIIIFVYVFNITLGPVKSQIVNG